MSDIVLRQAETDAEVAACFPVMAQLLPHLASAEELVARVARQRESGYCILAAWCDGKPVALAGYRVQVNLIYGKFLYVDDLVTEADRRRSGLSASARRLGDRGWQARLRAAGSRYRSRQRAGAPLLLPPGPARMCPALQAAGGCPMTTILQILASPRPHSFSRRIAREVTARLVTLNPGAEIVKRDLAVDPPPHPDLDFYEAILSPVPDDDPRFSLSEQMIRELEVADFVVIGTPMNNFSVPSTLKAWIDHIVRIRRTFRSLPEGKIGTLRDRPVFVISAHGGHMSGGYQPDFLTPYLRAIFETIGIRQVEFLCADGLSRGPEAVAAALAHVQSWIERRLPLSRFDTADSDAYRDGSSDIRSKAACQNRAARIAT